MTLALLRVTDPPRLVDILPFSLSKFVSGDVIEAPEIVNVAVGAVYDPGVISLVTVALAPTLSVTTYL